MNPDLKVYPTEIEIDEELEDDLKPGMNAQVEILVADLPDVLRVPMQAIHQSGGKTYAYVDRGGRARSRPGRARPEQRSRGGRQGRPQRR